MPQEHVIVWLINKEMNDERDVSDQRKKEKHRGFFAPAVDNFTLNAR